MTYDTFLFFNEFDCLDIRLHELSEVVDRFVLLESPRTFTNKPKPLYFQEYQGDRFDKFRDRIDVITLNDFGGVDVADAWSVEAHHRNCLFDHFQSIGMLGDCVLLSDADEIPSAEFVESGREIHGDLPNQHLVLLGNQILTWYWLNCRRSDFWTAGTRMAQWEHLWKITGEGLRKSIGWTMPDNAGWHFSYLGDIQQKLASFSHTEYDKPPYNTPEHIERCKRERVDLFGRQSRHGPMTVTADLSFLPQYVQDNPERFKELLCGTS